ncbi:hypothetical protein GQ457_01G014480 [Hibiscus cannabinus]
MCHVVLKKGIRVDSQKVEAIIGCKQPTLVTKIEYHVGDRVFLKVSPCKKVIRFSCKGKLSLRFIETFEVMERIGLVVYRLKLLDELKRIHDVFHVSMLWKYRYDPSHIVLVEEIEVCPDLTYDDEHISILDASTKVLRGKTIEPVKILWCNSGVEETT